MEIVTFEKNKLVSEIQDVLNSWLNEKPETRSVASLSRATGVADPAIRRLMNNNIKINDDAIFKLLAYIFDVQTFDGISSALSKNPEALKWFEKNYAYLKTSTALAAYKHSPVADEVAANAMTYSVYNVVLALKSVPSGYIKEQFGMRGEIELENLLKKGLLLQKDGEIHVKDDALLKFTKEQTVQLLPEITKVFFKADHEFNARSLEISAVSKDGYNEIMDAYENFLNQISNIYKNRPGNIPVVVAGFFDSLTTQPYFEGGKNETPS